MRLFWMLSALFCLLLVGCKGSSPLVGRWKLEPSAEAQASSQGAPTVSLEFKEDGTFSMLLVAGTRSDTLTGTYKLDGKTLSMTPTSEGGKPSNDPPEVVTMSEDLKSFPAPGAAHMGTMVRE